MKTLTKYVLLILMFCSTAYSQGTISMSNIDASGFPRIVSYISIMDYSGRSIDNIQLKDLKLIENGLDLSHTLTLDCRDSLTDPPLSISLILDNSNSMEEIPAGHSEPLKDWLKMGAKSFIDALNFNNGTKVEIISFSTGARLLLPFSSNRTALKNKIDSLTFGGGTNYNPPFIDPNVGAIKRLSDNTPANIRRVIVFLTDGDPDGVNPTNVEEIVSGALSANIQIYSITLNRPMNSDLHQISMRTGAKAYPVYTKEQLTNVYQTIASEIKTKKICKITWLAPFSCDTKEKERKVTIAYKPFDKQVNSSYLLPNSAYVYTRIKPSPLYFDNPDIGEFSEHILEITPLVSDLHISGAEIYPSTYFRVIDWDDEKAGIQQFNIDIPKNKTQKVRIRFTPAEEQIYRKATLKITANPCNFSADLIGGLSKIVLTSPNDGDVFSNCDKVNITWAGTKAGDSVLVYYKEKPQNYWTLLASNITGNSYLWTPPKSNQEYNFRVQSFKPGNIEWVRTFGSADGETVNNFLVEDTGDNMYLIGTQRQSFYINEVKIDHSANTDSYIACFDRDGLIKWGKSLIGPGDDLINDICFDDEKNVYITGRMNTSSQFEMSSPSGMYTNNYLAFVAKYNSNGENLGIFYLDPTSNNPGFSSNGRKIIFNPSNKSITIYGEYSGEYLSSKYRLLNNANGIFSLTLDKDYNVTDFRQSYYNFQNRTTFVAQDNARNVFRAGTYFNNITINGKDYASNGKGDVYLYKTGFPKFTEDSLEKSISIYPVEFDTRVNTVVFPPSFTGVENIVKSQYIYNRGKIPVQITSTKLTDNIHFTVNDINNQIIQPNDSLDLTFTFTPGNLGLSESKFIVNYHCHAPDTIILRGRGICAYTASSSVEMDNTVINKKSTKTFPAIIKNNEIVPIQINPEILGADKDKFKIINPVGSKTIKPKEAISIEVEFSPTEERQYQAYIKYNANTECNTDSTIINGLGINGDIIVSNLNFGMKRVKTVNTLDAEQKEAVVSIKNPTDVPISVNSMKFEDGATPIINGFDFVDNISLPINIAGNSSVNIKISFTPKHENAVSSNIVVNIDGKSFNYIAKVSGEGFIPKFEYQWTCPEPVNPGSTSYGKFTLKIDKSKSNVFIKNIKFLKNIAYSITDNVDNIVLDKQKNQIYTFNVKFSPTKSGMISDELIITSDAKEGPEQNPLVDSIYSVNCEANGNTYDNKLQFGKKILCGTSVQEVTVKNTSQSTPIIVTSFEITNDPDKAFAFNAQLPHTIAPNSEQNFKISFSPNEIKVYKANLKLMTNDAQALYIDLEGSGDIYSLSTNSKAIDEEPGKTIEIPLLANITNFNETKIDSITFLLKFNPTMLTPDKKEAVKATGNNATWKVQRLNDGIYRYSGIGLYNLPINGEVAKLRFTVFLGDSSSTNIDIQLIYNSCNRPEELFSTVKLKNICLEDQRRVAFFNSKTKIKSIFPNPISSNINIEYSLGIEAPVTIEVYNELGEKVAELVNAFQKAGDYKLSHNLDGFSSGVYYIKLNQSVVTEIKKINIMR